MSVFFVLVFSFCVNSLKYADDEWRNDAQSVQAELDALHRSNDDSSASASSIDNDIDCAKSDILRV